MSEDIASRETWAAFAKEYTESHLADLAEMIEGEACSIVRITTAVLFCDDDNSVILVKELAEKAKMGLYDMAPSVLLAAETCAHVSAG